MTVVGAVPMLKWLVNSSATQVKVSKLEVESENFKVANYDNMPWLV